MTKAKAFEDFKRFYVNLWINRVDYWTAQLAWSEYIDSLCKSGEITLKQYQNWGNPFPEGKRLRPTKKQLMAKVYG